MCPSYTLLCDHEGNDCNAKFIFFCQPYEEIMLSRETETRSYISNVKRNYFIPFDSSFFVFLSPKSVVDTGSSCCAGLRCADTHITACVREMRPRFQQCYHASCVFPDNSL